jgi:hypothetical protein
MMDQDQIIDTSMARSIQSDVARNHPLTAWVISQDQDAHGGKFVARLVAEEPTLYVMLADTLAELQARLQRGSSHWMSVPFDGPKIVAGNNATKTAVNASAATSQHSVIKIGDMA